MYKNKEFDYDLWTTETAGEKKYWVRVRNTNEVVEVNIETMRFLRNQEKGLYRTVLEPGESILSLDLIKGDDEMKNKWLTDKYCFEDHLSLKEDILLLEKTMTQKELSVYVNCFLNGISLRRYAKIYQLPYSTVKVVQDKIRHKLEKIMGNSHKL